MRDAQVGSEPVFERIAYGKVDLPLVTLCYDDQHGVYVYYSWDPHPKIHSARIVSRGPYLGASVPLSVDYPQKKFDKKQLEEFLSRCLAREPADRFPSAAAAGEAWIGLSA